MSVIRISMFIIIMFVSAVYSSDIENQLTTRSLLTTATVPTLYDLQLFLNPNIEYFNGRISMRIIPYMTTDEIILNADGLDIENIVVFSDRFTEIDLFDSYYLSNDTQLLTIGLNQSMAALTPHTIQINYTGRFNHDPIGLHILSVNENDNSFNFISSRFQPTGARHALPCYDAVTFQAAFRTTVFVPPEYSFVISNMPLRSDEQNNKLFVKVYLDLNAMIDEKSAIKLRPNVAGYSKYEFEDTPLMSPSLLSIFASDAQYIVDTYGSVPAVSLYSRTELQGATQFALDFAQRNLIALGNYFDFPYPLTKLDLVVLPDSANSFLTNSWGLGIYRQISIAVRNGVTPAEYQQQVAYTISRRNSQQWFGMQAAPLALTYSWLNEGLTHLFQCLGADLVLAEWRLSHMCNIATQTLFQRDSALHVSFVSQQLSNSQLGVDSFNYRKAGAIIRMMQHFLTPEVFQTGIRNLLSENTSRFFTPSTFYMLLEEALVDSNHTIPYNLETVMTRWTSLQGYPVITVRRSAPAANSISITQERYLTDHNVSSSNRWHVPVNWALSTDPDFSDTRPQAWVPITSSATAIDISGLTDAKWFIFNKQQTGYYRVNYDLDNWQALASVLQESHEVIHVLNRAQLIDDAFNLARSGRLDYYYAFELSQFLAHEKDYIPWLAAQDAIKYLNFVLYGSESVYESFKDYLSHLTAPLYEELDLEVAFNEESDTNQLKKIILDINCGIIANLDCMEKAHNLFQEFKKNPDQRPHPDVQKTVYCAGLSSGYLEDFDFLWDLFTHNTDAAERSILLNSLGCTTNNYARTYFISQVITVNSPINDLEMLEVIPSVIKASPWNLDFALNYFVEYFESIKSIAPLVIEPALDMFATSLTSGEQLEMIEQLISEQSDLTEAQFEAFSYVKENIAASIGWRNSRMAAVNSWLTENYGGSSSVLRSKSFTHSFCVILVMYYYLL